MMKEFESIRDEMTPIPGISLDYLAHCPTGRVYSKFSGWLLQDAKGTGDNNKYLLTVLKDENGNSVPMYLHEIIMSSYMGIKKSDWRLAGLEIDHIDNNNTRDCSISNLRLVSSKANKKNSGSRTWNKTRLSQEIADELREEFKEWEGSKVQWYQSKGEELGVGARSIQNIILNYTYQNNEEVVTQ